MTESQATSPNPRRSPIRVLLIVFAVAIAVAVPILPLRFLGIPGPDFPDVSQVVTTSKNWLSRVTSQMDNTPSKVGMPPPRSSTPAEQVKMLEGAADELRLQIQKSPCDPSLQNRLGLLYLSLGDTEHACQHFQKAISLARLGIAELSDKINNLKNDGKTKEASVALLDASKLNVELSAAHSNLARLYEMRGEHDKVISELDLLNKEGTLFDNSVAVSPGTNNAPKLDPSVARDLARAEALYQSRQYPLAATQYRKVIAGNPDIALAHQRLGTILLMVNNAALACEELEMAAKLDPGAPEVQADLGWAYQSTGMQLQAIKAYEHALALEPRQAEAAVNLSNIYSACGRMQDAVAVLTQAVQNNPNSAKVHNNLGTLFSLDGKNGPALYEFQKAVSLAPDMASAHYGLGSVLMQTRSYMPAIKEFRQALALQPNLVQAQMKIEEASRKIGMTVGSAQALN